MNDVTSEYNTQGESKEEIQMIKEVSLVMDLSKEKTDARRICRIESAVRESFSYYTISFTR